MLFCVISPSSICMFLLNKLLFQFCSPKLAANVFDFFIRCKIKNNGNQHWSPLIFGGMSKKNLILCSTEDKVIQFGTTWGWATDKRLIVISLKQRIQKTWIQKQHITITCYRRIISDMQVDISYHTDHNIKLHPGFRLPVEWCGSMWQNYDFLTMMQDLTRCTWRQQESRQTQGL